MRPTSIVLLVSDAYSFSVLPEEGNMSLNCTRLTFLSLLEVPFSSKNQMCLDAQLSFQKCIDLKVDREDAYSSCFLDINIEKETPDIFKSSDKTVGNLKSEGVVTVWLISYLYKSGLFSKIICRRCCRGKQAYL
ncbi:hypothetical protein V6Z12_A12G090400 [Gossypium hirsutum]